MAGLTEIRDEQLLKMMQGGDEDAFATLYRRRQGAIYRFVLEMSGSASLAEDVTQEVFMALIRDSRGYDPSRGSLGAYLLGMARHHALRLIKRDRTYVSISQTWDGSRDREDLAPLSPENPHSEMSRRESIHWVQQAILSLPEHYREAVVLCDLNEMSYEDAASVLGCSVGTVRSRLHRGRALLIQKLAGGKKVEAGDKAIDPSRCLA
ncbi:MAG: RNA polymerase sigma factor [Terriglobia bacterium]|jgi:RNA polymerase sigma-70 factor (ECF subfamily)